MSPRKRPNQLASRRSQCLSETFAPFRTLLQSESTLAHVATYRPELSEDRAFYLQQLLTMLESAFLKEFSDDENCPTLLESCAVSLLTNLFADAARKNADALAFSSECMHEETGAFFDPFDNNFASDLTSDDSMLATSLQQLQRRTTRAIFLTGFERTYALCSWCICVLPPSKSHNIKRSGVCSSRKRKRLLCRTILPTTTSCARWISLLKCEWNIKFCRPQIAKSTLRLRAFMTSPIKFWLAPTKRLLHFRFLCVFSTFWCSDRRESLLSDGYWQQTENPANPNRASFYWI